MNAVDNLNRAPADRFTQLIGGVGVVAGSGVQVAAGILSVVGTVVPFLPVVGSAVALGSGLLAVIGDWRELSKLQAARDELMSGGVVEYHNVITELDAKIRWMKVALAVDLLFSAFAGTLLALDFLLTFSGMPIISLVASAALGLYALCRGGAFIHYHRTLPDWTRRAIEEGLINKCKLFFKRENSKPDWLDESLLLKLSSLMPLWSGDKEGTSKKVADEPMSFWHEKLTALLNKAPLVNMAPQGVLSNEEMFRVCLFTIQFAWNRDRINELINSSDPNATRELAKLTGGDLFLKNALIGAPNRFNSTISSAINFIKSSKQEDFDELRKSGMGYEVFTEADTPVLFPSGFSCSKEEADRWLKKNPNKDPRLTSDEEIPNGTEVYSTNHFLVGLPTIGLKWYEALGPKPVAGHAAAR